MGVVLFVVRLELHGVVHRLLVQGVRLAVDHGDGDGLVHLVAHHDAGAHLARVVALHSFHGFHSFIRHSFL